MRLLLTLNFFPQIHWSVKSFIVKTRFETGEWNVHQISFIMQKYFSNWFRWLAARAKLTKSLFKSLLFTVKKIDFVTVKVLGYILFVTQNSAISKCVSNIVFDILWKKITIRRLHGWKISIICGEIIWKKIYLTNDFLVHRAETIVFILQSCYYFTIN